MNINLKRNFGSTKSAISTVVIAVIVIIVIAAGGIGAYYLTTGGSPSSSTTTSSSGTATTTSTTTTPAQATTTSTNSCNTATQSNGLPGCIPGTVTLSETGSTLLYPLFNLWVPNFSQIYYTNVKVNTAGTGSGAGIAQSAAGTVQIGASDAYLSTSQMSEYPNLLNIPLAISAQQIWYNIPNIPRSIHLNFSGPVLAGIYNGSITQWNSAQISALNPGASSLLASDTQTIIPIHRLDGSGDTFLFTQYLSKSTPSWNSSIGFGTTVSWPSVPSAQSETGNGGMVTAAAQNTYSIAYIGVSFMTSALENGLGYSLLENQAGNFVTASQANINAAASQLTSAPPTNEAISLIFAPGNNSYPIINYEYAMVLKNQTSATTALAIRTLLTWALLPQYGNSPYFLNQVDFVQLPSAVVQLSLNQIAEITGP
ncbi:MAG TPA: phosphate ABC transporter substrate-binding protein PstS [Nitrososphaerales archaeon]|nr:phosphate ABC transporter substrate-binding protein PstS [Nitrososphaerales archaeon]